MPRKIKGLRWTWSGFGAVSVVTERELDYLESLNDAFGNGQQKCITKFIFIARARLRGVLYRVIKDQMKRRGLGSYQTGTEVTGQRASVNLFRTARNMAKIYEIRRLQHG